MSRPLLNNDTDARRWAKAFLEMWKEKTDSAPPDEEFLYVWFANSIMCGYDAGRSKETVENEKMYQWLFDHKVKFFDDLSRQEQIVLVLDIIFTETRQSNLIMQMLAKHLYKISSVLPEVDRRELIALLNQFKQLESKLLG